MINSLRETEERLKESMSGDRTGRRAKSQGGLNRHHSFLREIQAQIEVIDAELKPNPQEISVSAIGQKEVSEAIPSSAEVLKQRQESAREATNSLSAQLRLSQSPDSCADNVSCSLSDSSKLSRQREAHLLK